jgi:hypothetical protein
MHAIKAKSQRNIQAVIQDDLLEALSGQLHNFPAKIHELIRGSELLPDLNEFHA